ncbi:universal stress protein [Lentzea sp. NBRC 105346]|uniref:universal stress protein n=1 Tax=Lentzea sp. NBRC 105346 TaxID=3032205 RepID=UPI0024A38E6B|nr:universal stress protein [Lentzea sp. NBRC 105346]GLZ27911.1 universal stress protein [Lentzea sp. NBRC 105346]
MRPPVILVGVDGSPASRDALRWALKEAARSGAEVEAMLAWQRDAAFVPSTAMGLNPYGEKPQRHPAHELHNLVRDVRAEIPDAPDVTEVTIVGDASHELSRASRFADILVVGTHGYGPLAEVFMGGVAADCLRHAECPVVVIPPNARRGDL